MVEKLLALSSLFRDKRDTFFDRRKDLTKLVVMTIDILSYIYTKSYSGVEYLKEFEVVYEQY